MPRKESHRSEGIPPAQAATTAAPAARRVGAMAADAAEASKPASLDAGLTDLRVSSLSAVSEQARASIAARRRRGRAQFPDPSCAAATLAEANETTEASMARKRAPLDGDLTGRRWRSLIGRHPPKSLSHALMDRILAWREQVADRADISSRSRAILAGALAGGKAEGRKNGEVQGHVTEDFPHAHRPRPHAPASHRDRVGA